MAGKRARQRRKRRKARKQRAVKQRHPTAPPCEFAPLRPSKAKQMREACRNTDPKKGGFSDR